MDAAAVVVAAVVVAIEIGAIQLADFEPTCNFGTSGDGSPFAFYRG